MPRVLISSPVRYDDGSGNIYDQLNRFILRIRGWGRLSKLDNPEAKQDMIGRFVADAINEETCEFISPQKYSEEIRELIKYPVKYDGAVYIWDANTNMILDFDEVPDDVRELVAEAMNKKLLRT